MRQALQRAGFELDTIEGSHRIMVDLTAGRRVSVPAHGSRDLKAGTVRAIIRDAGLTVEQFVELLR